MGLKFLGEIKTVSKAYHLDPVFVAAVIKTESNFDTFAVRYEASFKWFYKVNEMAKKCNVTVRTMEALQQCSHGLMQVMGATAYDIGLDQISEAARIQMLYIPRIGIEFGCKYIVDLKDRYSLRTIPDLYGAFNAGSVRKLPNGDYYNQTAVDRLLYNYKAMQDEHGDELRK